MFESASALAAQLAGPDREGPGGSHGLLLGELHGWELLQLSVFPGQEEALAMALQPLLGTAAPGRAEPAGRVVRAERWSSYRTAPDAWWVVTQDPALSVQLASAVPAGVATALPLSHSRVRLRLGGPAAPVVLARGISIDLHPTAFPVGAFAQTGLHHTGVLLERTSAEAYGLFVLRTYAQSLWEWLVDAARPYGYQIVREPLPSQPGAPGRAAP